MFKKLKELHRLRGLKAKHFPYEVNDSGHWEKNLEHEEEVILLEYFYTPGIGNCYSEGLIFIRPDWTLGRDRLDSFIVIK